MARLAFDARRSEIPASEALEGRLARKCTTERERERERERECVCVCVVPPCDAAPCNGRPSSWESNACASRRYVAYATANYAPGFPFHTTASLSLSLSLSVSLGVAPCSATRRLAVLQRFASPRTLRVRIGPS